MKAIVLGFLLLASCMDASDAEDESGTCDMEADRAAREDRCSDPDASRDDTLACCVSAGEQDCVDLVYPVNIGAYDDRECMIAYCAAYQALDCTAGATTTCWL